MRDIRTALAAVTFGLLALSAAAGAGRTAERGTLDPKLTAAIVGNQRLQARCGSCLRKVEWIGASYPRLTVDASAWRRLGRPARAGLARRVLVAASAVYLAEWAAEDIYQKLSVVALDGSLLMSFEP